MNKTLKISFSLKNTYRVNGILFSLKQIPLLKNMFPESLYKVQGLKIFANVLSVLWEIISCVYRKILYLITMVWGMGMLYAELPENQVFLHVLLFLTVIGSFTNTSLFNPSKDKYYAMFLMRMDAREYTLVNYLYSIFKCYCRFYALCHFLWSGPGRAFVVLPDSSVLYSRYETICCVNFSVGL